MTKSDNTVSWVVYVVTNHKLPGGMKAVCEQSEWNEMEKARPGYHTLVRSGFTNEADAERLARGTSGDPIKRQLRPEVIAHSPLS